MPSHGLRGAARPPLLVSQEIAAVGRPGEFEDVGKTFRPSHLSVTTHGPLGYDDVEKIMWPSGAVQHDCRHVPPWRRGNSPSGTFGVHCRGESCEDVGLLVMVRKRARFLLGNQAAADQLLRFHRVYRWTLPEGHTLAEAARIQAGVSKQSRDRNLRLDYSWFRILRPDGRVQVVGVATDDVTRLAAAYEGLLPRGAPFEWVEVEPALVGAALHELIPVELRAVSGRRLDASQRVRALMPRPPRGDGWLEEWDGREWRRVVGRQGRRARG